MSGSDARDAAIQQMYFCVPVRTLVVDGTHAELGARIPQLCRLVIGAGEQCSAVG